MSKVCFCLKRYVIYICICIILIPSCISWISQIWDANIVLKEQKCCQSNRFFCHLVLRLCDVRWLHTFILHMFAQFSTNVRHLAAKLLQNLQLLPLLPSVWHSPWSSTWLFNNRPWMKTSCLTESYVLTRFQLTTCCSLRTAGIHSSVTLVCHKC